MFLSLPSTQPALRRSTFLSLPLDAANLPTCFDAANLLRYFWPITSVPTHYTYRIIKPVVAANFTSRAQAIRLPARFPLLTYQGNLTQQISNLSPRHRRLAALTDDMRQSSGVIAPALFDEHRVTLVVDTGCDDSVITLDCAKACNLVVHETERNLKPAGKGNVVHCAGFVPVPVFRLGTHTLHNVRFWVADVDDVTRPHMGLLGLNLLPEVGIGITGVPVNFPRSLDQDNDAIDDPDNYLVSDWLETFKARPDLRSLLLKGIRPYLDENAKLSPSSFCTHPSAKVTLDTGDAKPVFIPQYRVSDYLAEIINHLR